MPIEEKHCFVCANTAQGFVDYFSSNLEGLDRVFILKGGSGTGKSTMMKKIGEAYQDCDYPVEYLHCSSDPHSLDGVIIPDLSAAVVDGTSPHVVEPVLPGAIEDYVNLGLALERSKLAPHKAEMLACKQAIKAQYQAVYERLAEAGTILTPLSANQPPEEDLLTSELTTEIIDKILGPQVHMQTARARHRFYAALDPEGTSYVGLSLIHDCGQRYGISGPSASRLLDQLQQAAVWHGYDADVYHNNLQPGDIDFIYLPALDACVYNARIPVLAAQGRSGDTLYDFTQPLPDKRTEEQIAQLQAQQTQYDQAIQAASAALAQARQHHDALEKRYYPAVDFTVVEQLHDAILAQLATLG